MDRGAWRATVHGLTKSQTRLNDQGQLSYIISDIKAASQIMVGLL